VFAKMKYSQPLPVCSVKGIGQSQQGVLIQSMDDLLDFNMVDRNLSLFSLTSKMSNFDMKPADTTRFDQMPICPTTTMPMDTHKNIMMLHSEHLQHTSHSWKILLWKVL
jgi:hypothetical protein